MSVLKKPEDELIKKITEILKDFQDFDRPFLNNNGNIIIKKKLKTKAMEFQF